MSYKVQSFIAVALLLCIAVFAGGMYKQESEHASLALFSLPGPEPFTVRYQVDSMTLREKIGQMFMVGFVGTELTEETAAWMRNLEIGGVVFLGGNITSKEQTKKLISDLQKQVGTQTPAPLFIAVDQEGGDVSRFRFKEYELRAQREIKTTEEAYEIAFNRGKELRELGVNVNFSPVLDVASSTEDFIYDRTFTGDADAVAAYGIAMIEGYRNAGVASVAKHFPGHGDTLIDSHASLPTISRSGDVWSMHLRPFRRAIQAEVPIIMSAHLKVPSIDAVFPASLSKTALFDILRNGLGFRGVIVSDDLGMGALSDNYAFSEIAVRAVEAGTDIVLVVRTPAIYEKMFGAIESAIQQGVIKEERINESVMRILSLKHDLAK